MTIAIMQPYLFPYIGYWQLINAVDTFVIYDDVNFIKKGYINRNSILIAGKQQQITLELIGASQNKLINEVEVGNNSKKLLKTIEMTYKKAPFFNEVFSLIKKVLNQKEKNLAKFIGYSLSLISTYLNISTKFIYSSDIEKNNTLKSQDKILDICKKLKATSYINSIGGQELYNKKIFKENGIKLSFLESRLIDYKQFQNDFIPYLSIVDILMFNSKDEIKNMLNRYELV
ncbi:WbqC-like protein family protein [Aliarcobacter thereius]|uniref:WbqC family protein n=1 Tax=Aliarcobacter thereius TaxID=544718 RepID=A0A1C0ASX8_9BACT|nr:WbqC family protein [Aliarcobacter thereius]OCL85274.1 WbqC-like protein family protein [Aliarcobacter thereius]OCL87504.1 WbqC-like protein family protein [Aliarcobacter thereius]OCL99951.1 WbqC-like protein family protein [Aliarcobacter thereius]TLS73343.1 WbqC family protein [Aliarcobacter thereius]TLT08733.1 WbqC family protein [Aliarcobacter thereius]